MPTEDRVGFDHMSDFFERYNTLIVDLAKGRPITTLQSKRAEDVIAWFKSRPQDELDGVEVVVLVLRP